MGTCDYTMLILSCDGFSDLWDGYFQLLQKHWQDRTAVKTMLVTDKPTQRSFSGVRVFSAGADVPWTKRLDMALREVQTDYVLVTLDDYFITAPVSNGTIEAYLSYMHTSGADYFRLFPRPKRATGKPVPGLKKVFYVDTSCPYSVNLYTGLWRSAFLKSCIGKDSSVWEFEVSLAASARERGALCLASYDTVYPFLDVVRKGKLLHSSARYLKEHPGLYQGTRPVNTWRYEAGLWMKTMVGRHTPAPVDRAIKAVMRKLGYRFYS